MKNRLIQNLSVNAVQLVINQLLGFGIFYVLSTGLDKASFGQINLALAVLLAVFNILSFGIDQLVVKKIAAGDDVPSVFSLYIFHVLFAGLLFYALLFLGYVLFLPLNRVYSLLLLIGIGKLMIFFANPFKQAANGMERFRLLAYMSVISNFVRCVGLIVLAVLHQLTIKNAVIVFISGDVAELLGCILLFRYLTRISLLLSWSKRAYFKLLREALPQTGVVLITSALARFDWIFIGFMVSAIKLAEYSFAYKIFEVSTLPLLAVAPLLIPRFTKMFKGDEIPVGELKTLARVEMIVAALIALTLNLCWTPVIDFITAGKYGLVNVKTIFILSLCMPLLYINNFLWTIFFARGQLKLILASFILTFTVNVVGNIILIPFFKNEGAAIAFFAANLAQTVFYLKKNDVRSLDAVWRPLVICSFCALAAGLAAKMFFPTVWLQLSIALIAYAGLLFVTGQLRKAGRPVIGRLFSS